MPAANLSSRGLALVLAAIGYLTVFGAFVLVEQPGLGLGHFFYVPVCIVALVTDELGGALAGVVAAGVYSLAVLASPGVPATQALTAATGIRLITFTAVGALVGLYAHRNRHLVERLRRNAGTDFVTGVANVRAFDAELSERCGSNRSFTLLLADVDELRRVNEVHGRLAGDAALRAVAGALTDRSGPGAFVARVGGDEFAVLTEFGPEAVPAFAARVNGSLAVDDLSVTVAATAAPEDGTTAAELFRKADDRLFTAKLLRTNATTLAGR